MTTLTEALDATWQASGSHTCVACGARVNAAAVAISVVDALCGGTPDSVHTLNPDSVEIGATTSMLSLSQPGQVWLFFASAEAREAYKAMYGHRYDYTLKYRDVAGYAFEGVITFVKGGQHAHLVPLVDGAVGLGRTDSFWDS